MYGHDSPRVGSIHSGLAHHVDQPGGEHRAEQIGRWSGKDVVQRGHNSVRNG